MNQDDKQGRSGPSLRAAILPATALFLALLFLAGDTAARMRTMSVVSSARTAETPVPVADPTSPTGYEHDQHRLVLPAAGTDGYHWIMQTERMLAGDGLRIRHTAVDNAPAGRAVHWSSPLRWWLAGLATVAAAMQPGVGAARMLEQVAPLAGPITLALLLLLATPALLRGFGPLAAAAGVLCWVAVFPLYEAFVAGMVDHHGAAHFAIFAGILLLAASGAGRAVPGDETRAHRLAALSGVTLGVGMWFSAATLLPVVAATAPVALLAALRRPAPGEAAAVPAVWRTWGAAGFATCMVAWLVEYFPGHMALRLEVNNPLYALAWLAAGDILARVGRARQEAAIRSGDVAFLAAGVAAILAIPATVMIGGDSVFALADPELRALHRSMIREFQPLWAHVAWTSPWQALLSVSLLPLVLLPAGAMMARAPSAGLRTVLAAAVCPAVALTALSFLQVRWLGGAAAAMAALLVILLGRTGMRAARRPAVTVALLLLLAPLPLTSMLFPWRFGYPAGEDLAQLASRDVAHALRHGQPGLTLVVAAPPTTTTWLAWFGGVRGIGTLYWENQQGLRAWEDLRRAADPDAARAVLEAQHAAFLFLPSWEAAAMPWLRGPLPAWLEPVAVPSAPTGALAVPPSSLYRVQWPGS